ncbi:hypothetical protein TNCV_3100871 [Trichonephila clavipes]|nr:hypothetical protein TNCV_3100871 [Trichonephila clavipes]
MSIVRFQGGLLGEQAPGKKFIRVEKEMVGSKNKSGLEALQITITLSPDYRSVFLYNTNGGTLSHNRFNVAPLHAGSTAALGFQHVTTKPETSSRL